MPKPSTSSKRLSFSIIMLCAFSPLVVLTGLIALTVPDTAEKILLDTKPPALAIN